jgi:superoxide dismutase, Fe-Mn family
MSITLPPLPYAEDALAPLISAQTLHFHHDKHHRAYVDKVNKAIEGKPLDAKSLTEIVRAAYDNSKTELFNNAAQAWNHQFLWESMMPGGGGVPTGELNAAIVRDFGGYDAFVADFTKQATSHFGSGWAWLIQSAGKLRVVTTHDADTPLVHRQTPLLTLDLWEHAYYLDYQNERPAYIEAFLKSLVNWEFAAANMASESQKAA